MNTILNLKKYIWFVLSEEKPKHINVIRVYIKMKASSTSPLFKYPTQSLRLGKSLASLQQDLSRVEKHFLQWQCNTSFETLKIFFCMTYALIIFKMIFP